jgi:hypothetical protein
VELPSQRDSLSGSLNTLTFQKRPQSGGVLGLDRDILLLLRQAAHKNHGAPGFQKIDVRNGIQIDDLIPDTYESSHISHPTPYQPPKSDAR